MTDGPDVFRSFPGFFPEKRRIVFALGSWEGEAADMYAALFTGCGAENVNLYGKGEILGGASMEDWWSEENRQSSPHRPRMLFLTHCKHIRVQGLHFFHVSQLVHPSLLLQRSGYL